MGSWSSSSMSGSLCSLFAMVDKEEVVGETKGKKCAYIEKSRTNFVAIRMLFIIISTLWLKDDKAKSAFLPLRHDQKTRETLQEGRREANQNQRPFQQADKA